MVKVTMYVCSLREPAKCDSKKSIGLDNADINLIDVCDSATEKCPYAKAIEINLPDEIAFPN